MIKETGNSVGPNQRISLEIPFYEFFEYLRSIGFAVEITDYLESSEFLKNTDFSNEHEIRLLKYKIASIICRNAEEQEKFYSLFDTYIQTKYRKFSEIKQAIGEVTELRKQKKSKIKKYFTVALLILPVLTLLIFLLKRDPFPFSYSRDEKVIQHQMVSFRSIDLNSKAHSFKQKIHSLLYGAPYDSSGISTTWNFGDRTESEKIYNPKHVFTEPGIFVTRLHFKSDRTELTHFDTILVCEPPPDLSQLKDVQPFGMPYFLIKPETAGDRILVWRIDGDATLVTGEKSVPFWFNTAGDHLIECSFREQTGDCSGSKIIRIDEPADFSLNVIKGKYTPVLQKFPGNLFYALNIFLLLSGLFVYWLSRKKKKSEEEKKRLILNEQVSEPHFTGKNRPFEIQFKKKNELIENSFIRKWSGQLMSIIRPDRPVIELKKTIRETIQKEGMFSPVYENLKSARRYLFLIDSGYQMSFQKSLFTYLAEMLLHFQVDLEIWYFDRNPMEVYNESTGKNLNIREIQDRNYQSIVMVWTDGFSFFEPGTAEISREIKEIYGYWNQRILITPVSWKEWSVNEKILSSFFQVFPADIPGLQGVVSNLNENNPENKPSPGHQEVYESKFILFEDVEELQHYFKDEEMLFQCICAFAVYPKVRWEIGLMIIHTLCPEKLTYSNLLKIARISWIQTGQMTSRLRLDLLKSLSPGYEIKARECIIKLLEESSTGENEYAADEKKLQLIVNKFVLYAHDPVKYEKYSLQEKEFHFLYLKERITDIPLKVYLEKNDPDYPPDNPDFTARAFWKTPIHSKDKVEEQINLQSYFNLKTRKMDNAKSGLNPYYVVIAMIVLLLAFFAVNWLTGDKYDILFRSGLVTAIEKVPEKWYLIADDDSCFRKFRKDGPLKAEVGLAGGSREQIGNVFLAPDRLNPGLVQPLTNFGKFYKKDVEVELTNNAGKSISSFIKGLSSDSVFISIKGEPCLPTPVSVNCGEFDGKIYSVYFEVDKADLTPDGMTTLKKIIDKLKNNSNYKVDVRGYSSDPEDASDNQVLSETRAQNVKRYLISIGLNPPFLTSKGYGGANPKFSNATYEGRACNRRVDIQIEKMAGDQPVNPPDTFPVRCGDFDGKVYSVYFDFDKADLKPEGMATLDNIVAKLNTTTDYEVIAEGHTNDQGTKSYLIRLSEEMAQSVVKYLISKGLNPAYMTAKGYGEENPKYPNNTAWGRECNRRVDIQIITDRPQAQAQPATDPSCLEFRSISDAMAYPEPFRVCSLQVASNEICDFARLKRLINLKYLNTGGAQIKNANEIIQLGNLESLVYKSSNLRAAVTSQRLSNPLQFDVTWIEKLPKLKELSISGIKVINQQELGTTGSVSDLELTQNNIGNISFIRSFRNLLFLSITQNSVSDLTPLEDLGSLTRLVLSNNLIENIYPLSALTFLKNLDLSNNKIRDIRSLEKLKNLQSVNLTGNPIPMIQINHMKEVLPKLVIEFNTVPAE